jgi:hypothetical protein
LSASTQSTIVTDILYYQSNKEAQSGDLYSFGKTNIEIKPFRVVSINRTQELQCRITALEYFDEIYEDVVPTVVNYSALTTKPAISKLHYYEVIEKDDSGNDVYVIYVEWENNQNTDSVLCSIYDNNFNLILSNEIQGTVFKFNISNGDTYSITLSPENKLLGIKGDVVEFSVTEYHDDKNYISGNWYYYILSAYKIIDDKKFEGTRSRKVTWN